MPQRARRACLKCCKTHCNCPKQSSPDRHYHRAKGLAKQWAIIRGEQLDRQPLCEDCLAKDIWEYAIDVHHLIAHRGDPYLFLHSPLMSLCKRCHAIRTARGE